MLNPAIYGWAIVGRAVGRTGSGQRRRATFLYFPAHCRTQIVLDKKEGRKYGSKHGKIRTAALGGRTM
jgi:hypothetical protein